MDWKFSLYVVEHYNISSCLYLCKNCDPRNHSGLPECPGEWYFISKDFKASIKVTTNLNKEGLC